MANAAWDLLPPLDLEALMTFETGIPPKRFWDDSRLPILANRFISFYAVDDGGKKYLDCVRMQVDAVWGQWGLSFEKELSGPLLHAVICCSDGVERLLPEVLRLGANPDVLNASHKPALNVLTTIEVAELFSRCRPILTPGDWESLSPKLRRFWETIERDGYPSVAQLAHDKHWYALQNLCRRQAVSRREAVHDTYKGKTAIEWVRHHDGSFGLEEEMIFLLKIERDDAPKGAKEGGGMAALREILHLNVAKGSDEQDELKGELAPLEANNDTLRREVEGLGKRVISLEKRNEGSYDRMATDAQSQQRRVRKPFNLEDF